LNSNYTSKIITGKPTNIDRDCTLVIVIALYQCAWELEGPPYKGCW